MLTRKQWETLFDLIKTIVHFPLPTWQEKRDMVISHAMAEPDEGGSFEEFVGWFMDEEVK